MSAAQETPARGIDTDVASLRTLEPDRAFERMYRRHASEVYRYALAIVRNEGDAEDVTQTTFLNAFRAMQRGERPQKAKSWLLAIAHNVCLQRFRTASRRPQQVAFDEDVAEAVVPEESPSADDLVRALQQISFNQRSALVMRELEGRSYAEIGEILDLPVSAVETLLFRARRAVREQLESSVTCDEAEELLSRQLDGRLRRGERATLRAHLRACEECAHLARSQRAQRSAWKTLALVPLPGSLGSLFGGGGATVATGIATKVAVVGAAAVLVSGGGYEGVRVVRSQVHRQPAKPAVRSTPTEGAKAPAAHEVGKVPKGLTVAKLHRAGHGRPATAVPRGRPQEDNPSRSTPPGQAKKAAPTQPARPVFPVKQQSPTKQKQNPKKAVTQTPGTGQGNGHGQANGHAKSGGKGKKTARSGSSSPVSAHPAQSSTAPGSGHTR